MNYKTQFLELLELGHLLLLTRQFLKFTNHLKPKTRDYY